MSDYQVLLLPKQDYWSWVEAAKAYAAHFGVNVTADPDSAGRYMTPQQTITIAGALNGYPAQGDIRAWFARRYPGVRLDFVPSASPADLQAVLQARVAANDRYLLPGAGFRLRWPTDYGRLDQGFGENPEIFRRWGLPGHEGLDIFAPRDAQIYACADGTVLRVDAYNGDAAAMPYGNSVRLQHGDGYQTIYGHLKEALVATGEVVRAGQVIGLADGTGNTAGDRLHLTLKKQGATAAGQTPFPNDIIDPTPFLVWPAELAAPSSPNPQFPWLPGFCLVGLHGRADGPMQEADYPAITQARIEAVKLLTTARPEDVDRLRQVNPQMFIMARLYASFENRVVRSEDFASWLAPEMAPFYQRGVRHFEVHNEPNLRPEGWTLSWNDGREFGNWFLDVRNRLRAQFPQALFGYPGLSPGEGIEGLRMRMLDFLVGSDEACRQADWIGLHSYWVSEQEFNSSAGGLGYLEYRRRFPDKLLLITEFSNPAPGVDPAVKGQQYARFYQHLRSIPGIGAAFSFVVSSSSSFQAEVWRLEDGRLTAIPGLVGARSDVITAPPPPPP